jgi:hypothetical protein
MMTYVMIRGVETDVRNDGRDPQLLANLHKLGQVKVPRGKVTFQQSNPMLNILAARQKNTLQEEAANTSAQLSTQGSSNVGAIKNRLNAQSIIALLDERKECKNRRQVEELAVAYDVDINVLDTLARWVNSPSVELGGDGRQRQPVDVEAEIVSGKGDIVDEGMAALRGVSGAHDFSFSIPCFARLLQQPDKINAVWTEPALTDIRGIRKWSGRGERGD